MRSCPSPASHPASPVNHAGQATALPPQAGFALILALTMLAFLTLLTLSLAALVNVETRSDQSVHTRKQAQQNALMALSIALSALQETAGPDQRVTATASILDDDDIPALRQQWTGVWNNATYNPRSPADKKTHFTGWLVSSPQGGTLYASDISAAKDSAEAYVTVRRGADEARSVQAPLVALNDDSANSYAYWVEDLGVKADVSLSGADIPAAPDKDALLNALSAAPAIHSGLLTGNAEASPWKTDPASLAYRKKIGHALSRGNIAAAAGSDLANESWIHFATGVYGLATDVRHGGLKQDLSLAFEMDGEEMNPNSLTRFNASDFAGNGNRTQMPTTALEAGPGQSFIARHLYLEPFTFEGEGRFARGPTWHLLRNHYNLYKELQGNSTPTLAARGIGPNAALWNNNNAYSDFIFARLQTGRETNSQGRYITLPTSGAYAPLVLKISFILSLQLYDYNPSTDTGSLALVLDPVIVIWNPYNVRLRFDTLKIAYGQNMFELGLTAKDAADAVTEEIKGYFDAFIKANDLTPNYGSTVIHYLNSGSGDTVMEPGEVMIFSSITPSVFESVSMRQKLLPGLQFSPDGGTRLLEFPSSGGGSQRFEVSGVKDATFTVSASLPGGIRFLTNTLLADSADLVDAPNSSLRIKRSISDEDIQFQAVNGASSSNPDNTPLAATSVIYGSDLIPLNENKTPALLVENTLKPANPSSSAVAVAPLKDFNPFAYMGTETLQWRVNSPNRHITFTNLSTYEELGESSGKNAFWGKSFNSGGSTRVIGGGIPQHPLLSIAGLRHAPTALSAFEAPQGVGNAFAHVQVSPGDVIGADAYQGRAWDAAWLMNDALFDRYFFSGLSPDYTRGTSGYNETTSLAAVITRWTQGGTLRNSRHLFLPTENPAAAATALEAADGYRKSAAHLLVEGSFNVNSTSPKAWAALLCGLLDIPVPRYGQSTNDTTSGIPVSKGPVTNGGSGDLWQGFRRLGSSDIYDEEEGTGLAFDIVEQVKLRGPFRSLADFVNRRLAEDATGKMGALQAAIESSGLNSAARAEGKAPDYDEFSNPGGGSGNTAVGSSGYILQADLLEPLAPFLSARSDTFLIRAYGQVSNAQAPDKVLARALCEVIVQRLPEYVAADANKAWDNPSALSAINAKLGRRFQIVSFRWLSPEETTQ